MNGEPPRPRQYYATTIIDPDRGDDAMFVTVSRGVFANADALGRPDEIAKEFEVTGLRFIEDPLSIYPVAAAVLVGDRRAVDLLVKEREEEWLRVLVSITPSARRGFVSYCCSSPVLPLEASPLSVQSLVGLLTKASGTATGGAVGFLLAGPDPLAFVLVPTGMILFGSAAGIGRGLEAGLETKIRKALGAESGPPSNG